MEKRSNNSLAKAVMFAAGLYVASLPSLAAAKVQDATISASVAETCVFQAPMLSVNETNERISGFAIEACNSAKSYKITATTRPLSNGERLGIGYDTSDRLVESNGRTDLVSRSGPIYRQIPVQVNAEQLKGPVTVTLSLSLT